MASIDTHATANETWRSVIRVTGQVQGVGFRPFVHRLATEIGLAGAVWNDAGGVTIEARGPGGRIDELIERVARDAPAMAEVASVREVERSATAGLASGARDDSFKIIESDGAPMARGRVTVDAATCPDCVRELFDAGDRRHRHGLINCTNCGPRYSIVRDLPYDRPRTTMGAFSMCPACEAEYRNPADRRFHAQPVCCPECGPQVKLVNAAGEAMAGDPFAGAAELLAEGKTIAMKGIGGYHLVVDAGNEAAVRRLRMAKKRDHKPFAVMARDERVLVKLVELSDEAGRMLRSPASPIVIARRVDRGGAGFVAEEIAPGMHRLGVMIPHTPMQHLLFAEEAVRDRVLVMTSANRSDDPLIKDDDAAAQQLGALCDASLMHDRPIERAVDDSVLVDAGDGGANAGSGLIPIRRARGFVPTPIALPSVAKNAGLCTGADLKSAVALVREGEAICSQHLGDLAYALALRRFKRTIADLQRLYEIEPRWIATDMHPGYISHRWAQSAARELGLPVLEIQHHHAHLASVMAEQGRSERTIGLILDGVGYGTDGLTWGGEVLVGDLRRFERLVRMRPLRLAGADRASKQTGRCAMSWLFQLYGEDAASHPMAQRVLTDDAERATVSRMLTAGINAPWSSGAGRLFDAAASLLGVCDWNHHEAMSGMLLEALAEGVDEEQAARLADQAAGVMELTEIEGGLLELDHRLLGRALVDGVERGRPAAELARLFHEAVAEGFVQAAIVARERTGIETVGLSGGVFCNVLLTKLVERRLKAAGCAVLRHQVVPPNDGGIALGQAAIAAAWTNAEPGVEAWG